MKYEIGDILTISGVEYVVLDNILNEDKKYIFTNKIIENDELGKEFYTFEVFEDGVKQIKDDKLLEILLPIFQNNINSKNEKYKMEDKYNV